MDLVGHHPPPDRAAELRADPEALERLARDGRAQVIVHRGTAVPVAGGPGEPRLVRLAASTVLESGIPAGDLSFLGLIRAAALFGFELPEGAGDLLPEEVLWLELVVASMTLPRARLPVWSSVPSARRARGPDARPRRPTMPAGTLARMAIGLVLNTRGLCRAR